MNLINNLFEGAEGSWSGGVAHILIIISIVIALGRILGKTKICGISFRATWVACESHDFYTAKVIIVARCANF